MENVRFKKPGDKSLYILQELFFALELVDISPGWNGQRKRPAM